MIPMNMEITSASGSPLEVLGGILIKIILNSEGNGKVRELRQLAYVAVGANQLSMCKSALCDLGLLLMVWPPKDLQGMNLPMQGKLSAKKDAGDTESTKGDDERSQCPTYTRPPDTTDALPMETHLLKLLMDSTVNYEAVLNPAQVPLTLLRGMSGVVLIRVSLKTPQ